jgi:hypothetical protein
MEAKMAYVARPSDFHGAVPFKATPEHPSRRGFWLRILDRLLEARESDAEQEVAQYLARRGKLTDSMEREIGDRFANGNWGPRF